MIKRIIILIGFCNLVFVTLKGQDLHFSQFMNSPLTTNPANTGFIPDGDYRIGINYRNQWSSIMAVPYKTMSAFGDAQLDRKSTRLNSSHSQISYAVFCLKKKKKKK